MRARVLSFCALGVLAFTFAIPAIAQFQQPTEEELKMTSDPKAPGAAAVYLDLEETANDPIHYETYYARIKVLTEKGKDLATVEVPYLGGRYKITDIKARTIHSDGTVIPLTGKPEDLLIAKKGDLEIGRKVFTLPSVEVGSVLEYRYQVDYDDNTYSSPSWDIQQPYFVHQAHYKFTPQKNFQPGAHETTSTYLTDAKGHVVNSLIWWANLPKDVSVQSMAGGFFAVDLTDIPPSPEEDWMPPIQSLLYKVRFYYKNASTAQDFWLSEAKDWSKEVDRFAEPSKGIREAVAGIVAPTDSETVKAQKIYKAVEALENTDYTRTKSESEMKQLNLKDAKHAEDIWKQKSGDSEDIAQLYLAMVRAAGLHAYAMKVVARDRGIFDASYMNVHQLNDTVILLAADGKGFYLDPGEKMAPFETVNWRHSDAGGMRQSDKGAGFQISPGQQYTANSRVSTGDITLDAHGGITGTLRIIMSGQEALRWRQRALRNDETEVKKQFDEDLEGQIPDGVKAHIDHFLSLDNPETNLMAVVNVEGSLGTATAKRLLLPGFFFEARGHTPFVAQEKRLEPVDMHYGSRDSEEITYHLPAGVTVEGAPPDASVPWKGHAVYSTKSVSTPGRVVVSRALARAFTFAKPEEYQDLRGFYQKVAAEDQQQLVLALQPAAQGN